MRKESKNPIVQSVFSDNNDTCCGIYPKITHLCNDMPIHNHDHYEIEIITDGKFNHWLNGVESVLKKGQVLLLGPTDVHSFTLIDKPMILNIRINPAECSGVIRNALVKITTPYVLEFSDDELGLLKKYFFDMDYASVYEQSTKALSITGNLMLLLGMVLKRAEESESLSYSTKQNEYVASAIRYINLNYANGIGLNDIANAAFISPNYLSEIFPICAGFGVIEYLTMVRIMFAQSLLINSNHPITEIVSLCGFNSFSSFSRAFTKMCGMSPSGYRKKTRAEEEK